MSIIYTIGRYTDGFLLKRCHLFALSLFILICSCNKNSNPVDSEPNPEFIFVERVISTTGELTEGDSTQITILHFEPSMYYTFDWENRILEYTSGEYYKVPINDDLIVLIASQHLWLPPDRMGLEVVMFPIYYEATSYIDSTLRFLGLHEDGLIELLINDNSTAFHLPIDSLVTRTYYRYKTHLQNDGDTALIKLTDKVQIYNHGYLNADQLKWKDISEGI